MAPTRKSRSVNKRYADYVDVSPSKISVKKSGQQKRKLSDMLGSPWADEEVERFYKAYRKYGKDWKKVASVVRTRNSEMAEALYTMNRAYLSLPEGTASVVGFVAMVSDHYNAMEGSDNDKEANDFPRPVQKPKKRTRRLLQQNGGEYQKQSRVVPSSDRNLPPLKIRESDGCTVRKRTPRFPVSHLSRKEISGNPVSPYIKSQKREVDEVAHGAALALTEALHRGGSPQVSQSPYHMKTTPPKGRLKILDTARSKLHGNLIDEDGFEGSSGSGGADNVGGEVYQKKRKFYGQKDDNEFDDGGEACSGTGDGLAVGIELADVNIEQSSSQGKRKRNKKLFFRDESSGLDALETLANLSLMIQSDSSALKEDKPPSVHRRYKTKVSADKDKGVNEFPRSDVSKSGRSKPGRESKVDYKALSEGKQLNQSTNKSWKRKNKSSSFDDKALRHLSSPMVRRWSTYEWFYSAIDYPWFAKREFVEYLHHVGLGHIPRLTKVEWGVIRSSLGKPRRFSRNFLREEREKLWQYRDSVRKHYTELRSGTREGLPTDLARPLAVGQRVIAIHPESREVYDGSVLNVDHDKCRIQFDRPDIGVAFVKDIDCMPLNPFENMPEALRRENNALYRFSMNSEETRLPQSATGSSVLQSSRDHLEQSPVIPLGNNRVAHIGSGAPVRAAESFLSQHAAYAPPGSVSQMQSRETDIRALSELTRALDKKEAILTELKLVNDGLMSHKNETGIDLKVTSALVNLRQRNTYLGNPLPPSQKPQSSSSDIVSPAGSADNAPSNNQLASNVVEIVNNSRLEAHKLVHTALQAMSKIKVEQNVRSTVATVLDSLAKRCPIEYGSSMIRPSEQANGGVFKHKLNSAVEPSLNNHASDSKLQHDSIDTDATIPFELIVSCVATYHMIQMCTERQYPPADVVQMLDSAFANLHPECPQNLPIFREIQMCMGRVKTQILALVPS